MAFLPRKCIITRSSIAFEDLLASSIAPQVMPPCQYVLWNLPLGKGAPLSQQRLVANSTYFKSASWQSAFGGWPAKMGVIMKGKWGVGADKWYQGPRGQEQIKGQAAGTWHHRIKSKV